MSGETMMTHKRQMIGVSILLLLSLYVVYLVQPPKDSNWLNQLPSCPCDAPQSSVVNDGWALDNSSSIEKFHPGAAYNFRSYPAVFTSEGKSAQQCCYDSQGKLLLKPSSAGTPDRETACAGEDKNGNMLVDYQNVGFHFLKDVVPFFCLDLQAYLEKWKPNNENNCK